MGDNNVSVYRGTFPEVSHKVSIPAFSDYIVSQTKEGAWDQMWVDLERTQYFLDSGKTFEALMYPLISWEPDTENPRYTYDQGEINSSNWFLSLQTELTQAAAASNVDIGERQEKNYQLEEFAFVYLDDEQRLCGVAVAYQKSNPRVFCASITRNCRAPADEREVFYMVSQSIAEKEERIAHPEKGEITPLPAASQEFRRFLGNKVLAAEMHALFSGNAVNMEEHARFSLNSTLPSSGKMVSTIDDDTLSESPDLMSAFQNTEHRKQYASAPEQRAAIIGEKPLRIRGNHADVLNYLGMFRNRPTPLDPGRDVNRLPFAETGKSTANAFLGRIKSWVTSSTVEDGLYYGQGDLDASNFAEFLTRWRMEHPEPASESGEIKPLSTLSLAFVDDDGIPCGVAIASIPGTPHWVAAITRNTMAKPEDREVEFLCSPEIAATLPAFHPRASVGLTSSAVEASTDFLHNLHSEDIEALFGEHGVFSATGVPSPVLGDLQSDDPIQPPEGGEPSPEILRRQGLRNSFQQRVMSYAARFEAEHATTAQSSEDTDHEKLPGEVLVESLAFQQPRPLRGAIRPARQEPESEPEPEPESEPESVPEPESVQQPHTPSFLERNNISLPLAIVAGVAAVTLIALAGVFTGGAVPTILAICGIVAAGICAASAVKIWYNEKYGQTAGQETRGSTGDIMNGLNNNPKRRIRFEDEQRLASALQVSTSPTANPVPKLKSPGLNVVTERTENSSDSEDEHESLSQSSASSSSPHH